MKHGFALLLLAGCGVDPTTEGLTGLWANEDAGTWRVFEFRATTYAIEAAPFSAESPAYLIRVYPDGVEPIAVQGGTYAVADDTLVNTDAGERTMDDVLVTDVLWSSDGTGLGQTFGDPIYRFSDDALTLRSPSADSGERTYDKVDALP